MKYSFVEGRENESPDAPAPAVVKAAAPRREASIVQSPLAPVHVLADKSAPSDLAETLNNEAVRALLKATIAAMELHELVDPPETTAAAGAKDDR